MPSICLLYGFAVALGGFRWLCAASRFYFYFLLLPECGLGWLSHGLSPAPNHVSRFNARANWVSPGKRGAVSGGEKCGGGRAGAAGWVKKSGNWAFTGGGKRAIHTLAVSKIRPRAVRAQKVPILTAFFFSASGLQSATPASRDWLW